MKIREQINEDLKTAMKAKDKVSLEALRAVKSAFLLAKTQEGAEGEISDSDAMKIIQKLVKQRKDSAEIFKNQSRKDLYEKELAEVKVLQDYLPENLTPEALKSAVEKIIDRTGAESMKDMGKVMGEASHELAGKAEGKEIAAMVKELLSRA